MGVRRKKACLDLENILLDKIRYAPGMRRTQKQTMAWTKPTLIALVWLSPELIMTSMRC